MTEKTDKQRKFEAIMAKLKTSHLQELPDRVTNLEELVLQLEHGDNFTETYQHLFRDVHSMKGSGGTFGFPLITTICHQMEDVLKLESECSEGFPRDIIDNLLQYVDLLYQVPDCYHQGDTELAAIEAGLHQLQGNVDSISGRCLVVEGSTTTQKLVSLVLQQEQADISLANSGIEALQRLLQENFDLLITSMAIGNLNGRALIAALRLSDSENAKIPTILLTSSEIDSTRESLKADIIIKKGYDMPEALINAYRDLQLPKVP